MPGDLILDGYDDLALVGTLIWPLYVLNLQGVGRAGGVIPHAVMRIVLIYIHSCSNIYSKLSIKRPVLFNNLV